jgi:cytochrome c-type biogenesis protein CcmH
MLIAAIGFVAIPLKSSKLSLGNAAKLAIAVVPLSALSLYAVLGSPGVVTAEANPSQDGSEKLQMQVSKHRPGGSLGTVASLIDGLIVRLQDDPEDAGGWLLLARSYQHVGQHADALAAYTRAQALGKTDIELEASLLGSMLPDESKFHTADDGNE